MPATQMQEISLITVCEQLLRAVQIIGVELQVLNGGIGAVNTKLDAITKLLAPQLDHVEIRFGIPQHN